MSHRTPTTGRVSLSTRFPTPSSSGEKSRSGKKGKDKRKRHRSSSPGSDSESPRNAGPSRKDMWRAISALSEKVDELKEGQKGLEAVVVQGLEGLRTQVEAHPPVPPVLPPAPATPKKVPSMLSRLVRTIHNNLGDMQFRGTEVCTSDHNKKVADIIEKAVRDSEEPGKSWKRSNIIQSCRNYHDTIRRRVKSVAEGKDEEERKENKRSNRRRRTLRLRRKAGKKVLSQQDQDYLAGVDHELMSDEESDNDADVWWVRRPTWRSKRLDKILRVCESNIKRSNRSTKRVLSAQPCTRAAPEGSSAQYLRNEEDDQQQGELENNSAVESQSEGEDGSSEGEGSEESENSIVDSEEEGDNSGDSD